MSKRAFTVVVDSDAEQWKPIPGYEGLYEASDLGRVRSPRKILKQRLHITRRYPVVELSKDGKSRETLVHRVVLMAFRGMPQPGQEACHNNGDRRDNRLTNLRWGTHSENSIDQVLHGTHRNIRKTHCLRGHEFTADNTYLRPGGQRMCRACRTVREARKHMRQTG